MTFEEFRQVSTDRLQTVFPELQIRFQNVTKLQGQSYAGLLLRPGDGKLAASLNLEEYYARLPSASSPLEVLDALEEAVRLSLSNIPDIDIAAVTDYGQMKERLVLQLIPIRPNEKELKELPHRELLDLALVYRLAYPGDDGESGILITQSLFEHYGITSDELHADALRSAPQRFPATLSNISDVLRELSGLETEGSVPLWVASVKGGRHGAGVIAYPGFLESAAAELGGDFYLLPSSVHEFLLLRADGRMSAAELLRLIHTVNENEVAPADRLSDSLYRYYADEKELCLVLPET